MQGGRRPITFVLELSQKQTPVGELGENNRRQPKNNLHPRQGKMPDLMGIGSWISKSTKERMQMWCVLTKYYIHLCKCDDNSHGVTGKALELYL